MVFETQFGRVLQIQIPRTGGSAVADAFLLGQSGVKRKTECTWEPHKTPPDWPSSVHRLRRHYEGEIAFSFSFVRHPLTWYESYFRYQTQNGWSSVEENSPDNLGPWVLDGCKSDKFSTFIDNCLTQLPGAYSQLVELYVGTIGVPLVDFIGKLETIAEDLAVLETKIGFLTLKYLNVTNDSDKRIPCDWQADQQAALLQAESSILTRFYGGK
jgi:hypothetical protein